jgi:hypothetical protein
MDNYIRSYDGVISKDSCKFLIDKFENCENHQETVLKGGDGQVMSFNQINTLAHEEWRWSRYKLSEAMLHCIDIYKKDCKITDFMWPARYLQEAIRIKRYLPNNFDRFDEHVDATEGCEKRFLNFLIYLNDVEEGGETEFPQLPLAVNPKAGTMVVFPPMWPWLHAGRKPISGPKYFAHSYLHYE